MRDQSSPDADQRAIFRSNAVAALARLQVVGDVDLKAFLRHAVKTAADVVEVARASVWLYTDDRQKIRCAELYERRREEYLDGLELAERDFPRYFEALRSERTIAAHDALTDFRTSEFSETYLKALGITSMLDAPIRVGGRMIGVVCHEHIGTARTWTVEEENLVGSLSDLVSLAIEASELRQARALLEEYNRTLEAKVDDRTRELRDKQSELAQAEKMAALGSLVAGITHEINTPLGALQSNSDTISRAVMQVRSMIVDNPTPESLSRALEFIDTIAELCAINLIASERIIHTVSTLKSFARLDRAAQDHVDINEGLDSTLTLLNHQFGSRIKVKVDHGDVPRITCFPNALNQVFMNLLVNAIQAIDGDGTIDLRTYATSDSVIVEIKDSGMGIPADNLTRIFDPGFTTKGVKVGTGLGLSIAYRIVKQHNGRIDVQSEPGRGSTFRVTLPIR
jgi:two-component system, NtrC family, sensor kinase